MPRGERKKCGVTLKDIAEATGFSANTVSHALANKPDISARTKALIKIKAAEMGYIANASASFLRSGVSKIISIIVGDISNPHFSIMCKEMQTLLLAKGYTTVIFNTEEKTEVERQAVTISIGQNVDGVLICPAPGGDVNVSLLRQHGVPFVMIGRWLEGVESSYVVCDDGHSGFIATKYLLDYGHRRILLLNGGPGISSARERQLGYRKALLEAGLPYEAALVKTIPVTMDQSRRRMNEILDGCPGYTAVLAFSDMLAWEVISALAARGRAVPGQCSVIGFDNIQSRFFYPVRLTSVSSFKATMAQRAVHILLHEMACGQPENQHVVLETRVVHGDTVGSA